MLLFAGLGNPGAKYAEHRHNVGAMAADEIARRHSFSPWSRKFQGLVADGLLGGEKVLMIKPQTFMNLSGQAVGEALRFYKLDPSALTVFYDELDLPQGKVRVKVGGGSGGHNGIRSIDEHIGAAYRRVRIGIGHPGAKELVTGHVLGDFAKADREWLEPLLSAIAENAALLAGGDGPGFMNKLALAGPGQATAGAQPSPARKPSHVRQARPQPPAPAQPPAGPLAEMLKKLLGKD